MDVVELLRDARGEPGSSAGRENGVVDGGSGLTAHHHQRLAGQLAPGHDAPPRQAVTRRHRQDHPLAKDRIAAHARVPRGDLDPDQRALLDDFQEKGALPDPPGLAFVAAVQEALKQLKGIPVKRDALVERLFGGGAPATPDQLRERLDAFLREIADGTDASKVRILLDS